MGFEDYEMLQWVRVLAAKSDELGERREVVSKRLLVKNTPLRKTALKGNYKNTIFLFVTFYNKVTKLNFN